MLKIVQCSGAVGVVFVLPRGLSGTGCDWLRAWSARQVRLLVREGASPRSATLPEFRALETLDTPLLGVPVS